MPWVRWPPEVNSNREHALVDEALAQRLPLLRRQEPRVPHPLLLEEQLLDALGEDRREGDEVGVGAAVRLYVRVVRPEQLLSQRRRGSLDRVDVLAACVPALPRGALRVLVRHPLAHCQLDGQRAVVLARDQLQRVSLVLEFAADRRRHLRRHASSLTERPSSGCASTRYRALSTGELPSFGVSYVLTQVSPMWWNRTPPRYSPLGDFGRPGDLVQLDADCVLRGDQIGVFVGVKVRAEHQRFRVVAVIVVSFRAVSQAIDDDHRSGRVVCTL